MSRTVQDCEQITSDRDHNVGLHRQSGSKMRDLAPVKGVRGAGCDWVDGLPPRWPGCRRAASAAVRLRFEPLPSAGTPAVGAAR